MADIAKRSDVRRRHDLVALRRQLTEQLWVLQPLVEPLFVGHGDARLLQDFRSKFSAMRTATALHQANWPAVTLDAVESEEGYRSSATAVQDANQRFIHWMRGALPRLQ